MGGRFAPSDEVIFLEKVYTLIKGVSGYLQGTMEGKKEEDDTRCCC
jgi:hypothetical protein